MLSPSSSLSSTGASRPVADPPSSSDAAMPPAKRLRVSLCHRGAAAGEHPSGSCHLAADTQSSSIVSTAHNVRSDCTSSESTSFESAISESASEARNTPSPSPTRPIEPPTSIIHEPTWMETTRWAETYVAPVLLVIVAARDYPYNWLVQEGSRQEDRIRRLVLRRLSEGFLPWPTWTCERCAKVNISCFPSAVANPFGAESRISDSSTLCYAGKHANCERQKPGKKTGKKAGKKAGGKAGKNAERREPSHEYTGDWPSHTHGTGERLVEGAHLIAEEGGGLGHVRRQDRTTNAWDSKHWDRAMQLIWRLPDSIAAKVHAAFDQYMKDKNLLVSERTPL